MEHRLTGGRTAGSGVPVQPQVRDPASADEAKQIVRSWASTDRDLAAATEVADERLARLRGDEDLVLELQLYEFRADLWELVSAELARYANSVLHSWCRRGLVFGRVRALSRVTLAPSDDFRDDEITSVVDDTIVKALGRFLQILQAGQWRAGRGATLTTYFIGQCLFRFIGCYRSWQREQNRDQQLLPLDPTDHAIGSHLPAAARIVTARQEFDAVLGDLGERERSAFLLREAGYTGQEIADRLDYADAKAVENMFNYRQRLIRQSRERA